MVIPPFPGINECRHNVTFRRMGQLDSREGIGCGFIHKNKTRIDHMNLQWPGYVLVLVIRGSGLYVDETQREYKLVPGDFFQRFPGRTHSNLVDIDSGYFEFYIECGTMLYQALRSMNIIRSDIPVKKINIDNELLEEFWRFNYQLRMAGEESLPGLVGDFIKLLEECHRRSIPNIPDSDFTNIIETSCRQLSSNFDRDFDIKKFCRQHGWGYEHFRKVFRQHIGISPWQYRVRRRLDTACSMLRENHHTINEISARLGYASPYEFSAQFKKYIGISPLYYREGRR